MSGAPSSRARSAGSSTAAAAPRWHALEPQAVLAASSQPEGLSGAEARRRRAQHGANVVPRAKGDSALDLLWRQIHTPLIWVLILSGAIAMVVDPTDGVKNGLVILAVVVLNTLIGFVQELKAGRAIESLSQMVPESVAVLRDGGRETLAASDLVPGDVVLLSRGDRVPADLRLFPDGTSRRRKRRSRARACRCRNRCKRLGPTLPWATALACSLPARS